MQTRTYHPDDLNHVARLLRLAFGGETSWGLEYFDPSKNPRVDTDQVHVIEEDGLPRATATVLPLEVYVDGQPVPMGGVAAVAADPAYRRRGYAGRLMDAALRDMRERGTHLSMLYPFNHAFYRRFGYELAADSITYDIDPRRLPTSDEQRNVHGYSDGDLPNVARLFDGQAARHQMCVHRSEARWDQVIGASKEPYARDSEAVVYERDGVLEGYLRYAMISRESSAVPDRKMNVREFVAVTPRAREGLVSFLGALDPDAFRVTLPTSYHERLHPYVPDAHLEAVIESEFMLRLIDVEGALGYLDRAIPAPLVIEVTDDVIVDNEGEYTVGDGRVKRGAHAQHRVRLDVRRLAQLYAGYLPAREMAGRGLVSPESDSALDLLEAYFPVLDPWVFPPDHF